MARRKGNLDIESVMRALDAVNGGHPTWKDRNVLRAAGGTTFRGGRFELALPLEELAVKIGLTAKQITKRESLGIAFAPADTSGRSHHLEAPVAPRRAKPWGVIGILKLGSTGKTRHGGSK